MVSRSCIIFIIQEAEAELLHSGSRHYFLHSLNRASAQLLGDAAAYSIYPEHKDDRGRRPRIGFENDEGVTWRANPSDLQSLDHALRYASGDIPNGKDTPLQ